MRFNRLDNKHFAELAENNGIFGSAQLSDNNQGVITSDYNQIPSLQAFREGWNSATLTSKRLPPLEEFQGLESYFSYLINYLYQEGTALWNSNQSYFKGSFCKTLDNDKPILWYSKTDNNVNNEPTVLSDYWQMVDFSLLANINLSNLSQTGEAHFANPDLSNLSTAGEAKFVAVPTGSILPYGGSTAPTGWLLCSGGAISRTTYAKLFAVIGTAYGAGDGSTTFNLPNYTGRVPQGIGTGYVNAGLPNIAGTFSPQYTTTTSITGSFYTHSTYAGSYAGLGTSTNTVVGFSASLSSGIYGNSTTVQPPATKSNFIIKY